MLLGSMHGAREMDAIWLETCNGAVCNGQQAPAVLHLHEGHADMFSLRSHIPSEAAVQHPVIIAAPPLLA